MAEVRECAQCGTPFTGKYAVSELAAAFCQIDDVDAILVGDTGPAGE